VIARALAALLLALVVPAAAAGERVPRSRFVEQVRAIESALVDRDFARLDRLHESLLASRTRTDDGTWLVESFEWAFDAAFQADSPARLDAIVEEWRRAAPQSALRPVAEAFVWQGRAWRTRGGGCSPEWMAGARTLYARFLERAQAALDGAPSAKASPLWYTAAIRVAGGAGRRAEDVDALLEEGAARHPGYRPLYSARLAFLTPEWGGDYGQVDRFVRRSVERTRATEGTSYYATLYVDLAREPCGDPLGASEVSWPEMKRGFADLLERHDSTWNWNLLGTFACRFRDADETARALARLGKDARLGIWSEGISTESCRTMVRGTPPSPRAI
jgi:hypothetical protein